MESSSLFSKKKIKLAKVISTFPKRIEIKLQDNEIKAIIDCLPAFPKLITYEAIWQLGPGKHSPCIHDAVPNLTTNIPMKKSCNGKTVTFHCKSIQEAQDASNRINFMLGRFGYKADFDKKYVIVQTSKLSSVSVILKEQGLLPLICDHDQENEIIIFAQPCGLKKFDIHGSFNEHKKIFHENFGIELKLPRNLKKLKCCNIVLPDFEAYNPDFMKFVIENKPSIQQLKSYITLYHLAELGIPIHIICKRDLVKIIQKYTKIPKKTLEKQLIEKQPNLQKRLEKIYSYDQAQISIQLKSDRSVSREILTAIEYHLDGLKETVENKDRKESQKKVEQENE